MSNTPSKQAPLNLGHRGASAHAPENTLAAFSLARELGADGIEFDVRLSLDGELVIMHDDKLERTTNGHGRVREVAWRELQRLDAGGWFSPLYAGERIPRMQDVFDMLGTSLLLNIELKSSGDDGDLPERVVAFIRRHGKGERTIVSSFDWRLLERVRLLAPTLHIGVLFNREVSAADYEALKPEALHPARALVRPDLISAAHASRQAVNTWTVDSVDEMREMIALGVDAIITNDPWRLNVVLGQTSKSSIVKAL